MAPSALRPLEPSRHPAAVELEIPALTGALAAVANELRARAASDRDFLRLALVQQSADAVYHLDSDAATAITGDAAALNHRQILRLLLNLSTGSERALHYLDVDPGSVDLAVDGSYVRVADPGAVDRHALIARIPPRRSPTVHGLVFASNRVLHSGVDNECGHFVAAYGVEADTSDAVLPG